MSVSIDLPVPTRVLAIGAHPDDIEFGCGATLAKWATAGAEVHLCVCTDGSKGTWDADADLDVLRATRVREQGDALRRLGGRAVHWVGMVDGELDSDLATRAVVCDVIRATRPDVVIGHDPWQAYQLHPDHRQAGRLAIEGIVAARDPHFFPGMRAPHRPSTLLLFEANVIDHVENVADFVDAKIEALLCHRSQWRSTMGIHERPEHQTAAFAQQLIDEAQAHGLRAGLRAAEAFKRTDDL